MTHRPIYSTAIYNEIQQGNVSGFSMVHKFGRNNSVPNGSWAFVSLLGHTSWPLSSATTVRIKAGGDAEDASGGDGAREVTVQGIDSNFDETSEVIATNGASVSLATTASFWRIHRAWVSSAGVYGNANTDDIVIENSGGGTDLIKIAAGEGQTQFAAWTTPAEKTAYLLSAHVTVDGLKPADVRCFTRNEIDNTTAPVKSKRLKLYWDGISGSFTYSPLGPELSVSEKSDIWFEAQGSGALTEVSVDFELLVVDD